MDYLVIHASAIMQLCFGGGFLLLVLFLIRPIIIFTRILQKVDDISDLFIEYIQKPLRMLVQAHKFVSGLLGFLGK